MKAPLVSIITPCFNGENYLDRYFESILNQTYPNIELIFVNDGSTDKTEEIALSYQQKLEDRNIKFIYIYQKNAGQAAALNKGLKIFKGDYLTWPDSDDTMTPDCIEKKVEFLEKNKNYDMVRSNGIYYDEKTHEKRKISNKKNNKNEKIFEDLLVLNTYGCCGCYMITRRGFLNSFPNKRIYDSRCGQNWQILLPVASRSLCGYIDEDLYTVFLTRNSHSRKQRSLQKEIDRYTSFLDILLHSINESDCNKRYFRKKAYTFCYRNQFYYSIALQDKILIKKYFKLICRKSKPHLKEIVLYIKHYYLKGS